MQFNQAASEFGESDAFLQNVGFHRCSPSLIFLISIWFKFVKLIDMKNIVSTHQIKAARMLLAWDQVELARRSSVGVATLRRIEAQQGVASAGPGSVAKIVSALESAGIEFLGSPNDMPGVRLTKGSPSEDNTS